MIGYLMIPSFVFFNHQDLPQAIRIKLISKDSLVNGNEVRLVGFVERDANDERNGQSETKQMNGNDSPLISTNRQHELGAIRYVYDGIESTIQYSSVNLSNTSALYYGDKVNTSPRISRDKHIFLILRLNSIRHQVVNQRRI